MKRRAFLLGLGASAAAPATLAAGAPDLSVGVGEIERRAGGRLGVAVLSSDGRRFVHRGDERFPMCSTFKALAAAAVLKRVDAGALSLERKIAFGHADLLDYAPATRAHVHEGAMGLGDLCAAAIRLSDNTAANLILRALGGPQAVTELARSLGDEATRLDRDEPALNSAIPGDPRDTTTPMAMARDLRELIIGEALSDASRRRLEAWMIASETGAKRLRAGLPPNWGVGDKTGSGENGATNTIAIFRPPRRAALFVAVYLVETGGSREERDAVHRDVAKLIAETF